MTEPMGTAALDQVVVVVSYIPTVFAIVALATAGMEMEEMNGRDKDETFEDKKGVVGGMCGMVCLGYAIMYCVSVGQKSPDMCKILIFARFFMGAMFVGGGCFLVWKQAMTKAVVMFVFGGCALPEGYLLFVYGQALARERNPPKLDDTGAQMTSLGPPSQAPPGSQSQPVMGPGQPGWGITPMSMPGSFGIDSRPAGGGFGAPPPQQYYG